MKHFPIWFYVLLGFTGGITFSHFVFHNHNNPTSHCCIEGACK